MPAPRVRTGLFETFDPQAVGDRDGRSRIAPRCRRADSPTGDLDHGATVEGVARTDTRKRGRQDRDGILAIRDIAEGRVRDDEVRVKVPLQDAIGVRAHVVDGDVIDCHGVGRHAVADDAGTAIRAAIVQPDVRDPGASHGAIHRRMARQSPGKGGVAAEVKVIGSCAVPTATSCA